MKNISRVDEKCGSADAPILWSPNLRSRLIGEDPDAGKD